MLVIPIKFEFSADSEARRVKQTLDSLQWLTKNKYRFLLPGGIGNTKNTSPEIIKKTIGEEYSPKIYQVARDAILKSWNGNNKTVRGINQKMAGSHMLEELNVILTRYGTQGSYMTPNTIIINISNIPPEFLIKTVVHESLHLMIENLIREYSVEHWVKERIVDLIMDLEYKSRFKMQPVPDWALAVDTVFKEHYPDIELVIKKAAGISSNK